MTQQMLQDLLSLEIDFAMLVYVQMMHHDSDQNGPINEQSVKLYDFT